MGKRVTGDAAAREARKLKIFIGAIYVNAFALGAIIMGFEMLGSRYLAPYFGGDIFTWGALISTVLMALMLGAYAGGHIADKRPSTTLLGLIIIAAAAFLFLLPLIADPLFGTLIDSIENVQIGVLVAAFLLNIIPVTVLGVYTPFAVRLLLQHSKGAGRLVGSINATSTFGSITGTLATTFFLIPAIGSRDITTIFAFIVLACAVSHLFLSRLWKEQPQ